ncbi:protein artichoke [Vespula squamosa]|uniref:Protein artichoke n=1 Tax=Vespula squamosa TaxID=30214 RepID=A0ABD2AAJ1_VESSQ
MPFLVSASLKRITTNFDVELPHFQPTSNHPPTISTYLIFNQLHIIHPQFRPKSWSSVLEPSQNFLSKTICRRHKLWFKRATIRLWSYFRRFNRNLREWLLVIFEFYYVVTQNALIN